MQHWMIVAVAGLLFFAAQLALCLRFSGWLRAFDDVLQRMLHHLDEGGDGRVDLTESGRRFAWLGWVARAFPAGQAAGSFTREDVLHELDMRVAGNADYLLLQRMGVMAPLLGVVLTVLGFPFIEVPAGAEMQEMLGVVAPLVAGVGTGAVLALVNQFLLHVVGGRTEALRVTGRTWFDTVVWRGVGLDTRAATTSTIAAMQTLARAMTQSAEEQRAHAERLAATSVALEAAGDEFGRTVRTLGSDVRGLPEVFASLREASGRASDALNQLIPVGQRALAELDVSVSAFRSTIDNAFVPAVRAQRAAIDGHGTTIGGSVAGNRG